MKVKFYPLNFIHQFSVRTDVIDLCGKIRIQKSYHCEGQAM